jgi:hypothetical protein
MIAVDTSALRAIVLNEAEAGRCMAALEAEESVPISAGTLAEAFIVSARRNIADEFWTLVDGDGFSGYLLLPQLPRGGSGWLTNDGERDYIQQASILEIALRMKWRRHMIVAFSICGRRFLEDRYHGIFGEVIRASKQGSVTRQCPMIIFVTGGLC